MSNLIRITRDHNEAGEITIFWREKQGQYSAYRHMFARTNSRIPELDTDNLLEVMKYIRDFLAGTMNGECYTPGETA